MLYYSLKKLDRIEKKRGGVGLYVLGCVVFELIIFDWKFYKIIRYEKWIKIFFICFNWF